MLDEPAALPSLRETEIRLRSAVGEINSREIDLDMHCRHIAVEVTTARRKAAAQASLQRSSLVGDEMERVREEMARARERLARRR